MQILPVLEEAFELVREYLLTEGYKDTQTVKKNPAGDESKVFDICLLYTSPSPRDLSTSRMPSSA